MTSKWPWPADSPLDIARRLLQSYRSALKQIDPEACRRIDDDATNLGQGWVAPRVETVNPDDLVSAVDAAALVGVEVATIYQWASRKHIPRHHTTGRPTRYRVGDILDHVAASRRARALVRGRRKSGPAGQAPV